MVKYLVKWNIIQKLSVKVCNADKQSWASLHIFPRNWRNTLGTESFLTFFLILWIFSFFIFFLVSHEVEETANLCSAYLMF